MGGGEIKVNIKMKCEKSNERKIVNLKREINNEIE